MHPLLRATLLVAILATSATADQNGGDILAADQDRGGLRARPDVEVVETRLGVVEGVVIDDAKVGIAGIAVRIVGEATVTTVYANTYGQFRATLLPPGSYRIEVARGTIREPYPRSIQLDRRDWRSCILPLPPRTFEKPLAPFPIRTVTKRARIIDLSSTTLGIRLGSRELLGR